MIGAAFAVFYQGKAIKRWAVFLLGFPLVFGLEVTRNVIILGVFSAGPEKGTNWFARDFQGAFQVLSAVGIFAGAIWLMEGMRLPRWLRSCCQRS